MSQVREELAVQLKRGMRRLASGVCIITARSSEGSRLAMTVSSVTSVSDAPPSLLVCVNKSANMASSLSLGDSFCINVLNQSHQAIANACATPEVGDSRFSLGDWILHDQSSVYYLKDSAATFFCSVSKVIEYGTHYIYIGDLSEGLTKEERESLLAYAEGEYYYL